MSSSRTAPRQKRVFDSVFGGTANISQPTPVATPATAFPAPGQPFGALQSSDQHNASLQLPGGSALPKENAPGFSDHVEDQVKWDRSWHIVTCALKLPDFPENRGVLEPLQPDGDSVGPKFYDALEVLLYPQERVPFAQKLEDIVAWHTAQVRQHFLQQILPIVDHLSPHSGPELMLRRGIKILEMANRQYFHGLSFIKDQIDHSTSTRASVPMMAKFRLDLFAVISNSTMERLSGALELVLKRYVSIILGIPHENSGGTILHEESTISEKARRDMLAVVESLSNIGLAGEKFQFIFAEIMNKSLSEYVDRACRGMWSLVKIPSDGSNILPRTAHHSSPSKCVTDLCQWIENRYAKLAVQVLNLLESRVAVSWADKERFKEMGIGQLAELRIHELFNIVVNWPNSQGALDDLRTAIATPQRRLHLTEVFSNSLSRKLLHPGASTLQILQTYISIIWSFHALDHSKVLLDRVAYPLQVYLCSREDTVRIIITGLLSDTEDSRGNTISPGGDRLVELAHILNSTTEAPGQRLDDEELDWHDLDWLPDPVDAGPGYKRSKNADIIGTLIGALGSGEVFIKEFQNILGENLLKNDGSFKKEIKVLDLLKGRFGEGPLQACEVMLNDMQESDSVNRSIRILLRNNNVHAKILSRLFWPQLQDVTYKIPEDIAKLQEVYKAKFENVKASRKLAWLPALGQATVELQLEDRDIIEDVHTWQATIIWAFNSEQPGLRRTVQELVQNLEMEEGMVRSALRFWVNKLVLQEVSSDTFSVLETLNQEDRARSNAQAAASAASGLTGESADDTGLVVNDGISEQKQAMYWQFIKGMLKNSSSQMPLQQISMMLAMLVVEGFPYGNEQLQELLARKVEEGSLDLVGGKYRLKK